MEHRTQDNRYEQLCSEVRTQTDRFHNRNRARIRYGTIILVLLPLILGLIRWLTDSDKALFLLIWVFCLFAVSAYLIGVEYLDHSIRKKLEEITDGDVSFEELLTVNQKAEAVKEKILRRKEAADEEHSENHRQ